MPTVADFDQLDNPYRASSAYAGGAATAEAYHDGALVELQAYVGRKADYYLRKWAPRLESADGETGFNWAAFFLTAFWMAYRKMYLYSFLCIVASAILPFLVQVLFIYGFRAPSTPPSVTLIVNIMFSLVCGAFGNAMYLAHARRQIATLRARGLEGEQLLCALARRGGTSWLGAFSWILGPLMLLLLAGLLLGVMLAIVGHTGH